MWKIRAGAFTLLSALFLMTAIQTHAFAQDNTLHIRIAHLSLTAPAVDIYLGGKPIIRNLAYKGVSDYLPFDASQSEWLVVPANASPDQALTGKPFKLALPSSGYITVTIIGSPNDNTLELLALPTDARPAGSVTAGGIIITGGYARSTVSSMMPEGTPEAGSMSGMNMGGSGDNSAVYMHIQNTGAAADKLLSVETDVAMMVGIHQSVVENGMAKMLPVEGGLDIPAGGSVELKPGGYHIMLMDVKKPLKPGDSLNLILKFASGIEARLTVPVIDLSGM
jgi:copper(I)-binding protein